MHKSKLELIEHNLPNSQCINSNFVPGDDEVRSIGLFLKEMNDHTGLSHTEDEIMRGLFDEFSRCFIRDRSIMYAILRDRLREEYTARIDELRKSNFEFISEKEAAGKMGLRYRLLYWRIDSRAIYVKNARWEDLSRWYQESDSWRSTCYMFLISPVAIEEWIRELARLSMATIGKAFLRRNGRLLFNHFEHGMEYIGLAEPTEPTEAIEKAAKELSRRFNLPLQIVETRHKEKNNATLSSPITQ